VSARLHLLAAAALIAISSKAMAKDDYAYGPLPEWDRYKQLGEAAVRAELPDPANWQIEWPNGYLKAGWSHKGKVDGYLTCGVMRATGPTTSKHYTLTNFAIVIDQDQVKRVDISTRAGNSLVNVICRALVNQGKIPPASLMDRAADPVVASLGLTIRPMPEGAYVVTVAPDSAGQRAGITAGTVVTKVNGIVLAGMGVAMNKLLSANTAVLAIETVAGDHLEIKRVP
jgi:hypothetical protein